MSGRYRRKRTSSDGSIGEQAIQYWFNAHGWTMFRSQPEIKIVAVAKGALLGVIQRFLPHLSWGHIIIARMLSGGIADFTGYDSENHYRACEVKEASGETMPASRLDKDQRDWMEKLNPEAAFVGVLWSTGEVEMFGFIYEGSYKMGCGIK